MAFRGDLGRSHGMPSECHPWAWTRLILGAFGRLLALLALPKIVQKRGARRNILGIDDDDAVVADHEADVEVVLEPLGHGAERHRLAEANVNRLVLVYFRGVVD